MVFFANTEYAPIHIAAGQLLATAAWIGIGVAASAAAQAIPGRWLAVLGVVPIALGLAQLKAARAHIPGLSEEREQLETDSRRWQRWTGSRAGAVALVALANGGDNIAVNIALFSTSTPE